MTHKIGFHHSGIGPSLFVKDHPPYMWYREAIQNSIEASSSYTQSKNIPNAEIKIRKLNVTGLIANEDGLDEYKNKLSVYNLGGMTAAELTNVLSIGGTGKTASLNANFGVGIKTSVLNWSDLLIITYKNGIGHYAWLGKQKCQNGIDFDIVSYSIGNDGFPVEECTSWIKLNAKYRSYDIDEDFTEIVILGNDVNQDTYINTFGFGPAGQVLTAFKANHIKENLCKRYFRIPENIKIKIDPSANNTGTTGSTVTFTTFLEAFEKAKTNDKIINPPISETCTTVDGIDIHYFWDGPCGENYNNPTDPSTHGDLNSNSWATAFSGFVWRDEIYDPKTNNTRSWKTIAMRLGIQDNFNYFRIFVEIPDRAVQTDKYRTYLQSPTGNLSFDSDENLSMIKAHMPEWFVKKTSETKKVNSISYQDRLNEMFSKFNEINRPLFANPGKGTGTILQRQVQNTPGLTVPPQPLRQKGSAQKNLNNPQQVGPTNFIPTIREADAADVKAWQIKNNFCCIVQKGGDDGKDLLIWNPNYDTTTQIANSAIYKFPDPDVYLDFAKSCAKDELVLIVALWIMICRTRIAEGNMLTEEFTNNISSPFVDTYIFAHQLQIIEKVEKEVRAKERQDNNMI